jgi:hypothetical protein
MTSEQMIADGWTDCTESWNRGPFKPVAKGFGITVYDEFGTLYSVNVYLHANGVNGDQEVWGLLEASLVCGRPECWHSMLRLTTYLRREDTPNDVRRWAHEVFTRLEMRRLFNTEPNVSQPNAVVTS